MYFFSCALQNLLDTFFFFSLNAFLAFLAPALFHSFCQHNLHEKLYAGLSGVGRGISTPLVFL